ncbi:MAG: potassium channel family protein [Acidimicrobiales bacterium]
MTVLALVAGVALVGFAVADLLNTLVTTSVSAAKWWPSQMIGLSLFQVVRHVARRMSETSAGRERVLASFGPLLVLIWLAMWSALQIVGFGLIWWAVGDVAGASSLSTALYYSGVVYFTVGFGEVLPSAELPRIGAVMEAFSGVVTVALVIGYLPTMYGEYSARERKLMTLDDGSDDRITPTHLVMAWAPDADPARVNARMAEWEEWVAGILETHSTMPLLQLFRSHDRRQNWVTALGLLCDAAVHAQIIVGASGRHESYWFLRRAIALFEELTDGVDLTAFRSAAADRKPRPDGTDLFDDLYRELADHGFELLPIEEARNRALAIRARWAPQMEYLIDYLVAPRGFWSTDVGLQLPEPSRST